MYRVASAERYSSNSALGLLVILGVVEQVVLQLKRRLWLRGGGTAAAAVPLGSATIYSCYAGITIATCCSCRRRAAAAVAIEYNRDI